MATTPRIAATPTEPRDPDLHLFPVLTPAQVERASRVGTARSCDAGDVLVARGVRAPSIYLVVHGMIEVVGFEGEQERPIARLGPGQFSGEVGTLAGQPAMVVIRAVAPGELIEIGR